MHPRSSTASVFTGKSAQTATGTPSEKATTSGNSSVDASGERSVTDILDNPELSLNAPQEKGFNPYDTGAFNRSQSWDRISKQRSNR